MQDRHVPAESYPPHPRTIGWVGTTALAMGGANQSLFLIPALFVGQGAIPGQGSAAVVLLGIGLLLSWAAAPGWIELVLMWRDRVGGISATCAEAFKPYAPILANLAGVCYWWGRVPTCGLTALLSASALHQWYLPSLPVAPLACGMVLTFTLINLCGVKWIARFVIPIACFSAVLAFASTLIPILNGDVDWQQATDFHLTSPFAGWFGEFTSLMAGLYLIGFAAPAFEAAACHVGETIDPEKNVPRAMFASAAMATVYCIALPVVWLGLLGPEALGRDLALELGPSFAPLFGAAAKACAIWFMMINMFHGTAQPLAGAARTLAQIAEDGLLPKVFAWRNRFDAPWFATVFTASMSVWFVLIGGPIWLIAAGNFTYLIGICLPSVAVWLLRRDQPDHPRPYRAPRGTIMLGLVAALCWLVAAVFGFQQFGLRTVIFGLLLAYSGAALYAIRAFQDRRERGLPGLARSMHLKLTGAMLLVLVLNGAGYLIAVEAVADHHEALVAALSDLFVVVAIVTMSIGLVLPGMIGHAVTEVSLAARHLAANTVRDLSLAMTALGAGRLESAHARVVPYHLVVKSKDELSDMAASMDELQAEVGEAARGLDAAREGLRDSRDALMASNAALGVRVLELHAALKEREKIEAELVHAREAAEAENLAKSRFLANMSHEIRTPMNGILGMAELLLVSGLDSRRQHMVEIVQHSGLSMLAVVNNILDFSRIEAGKMELETIPIELRALCEEELVLFEAMAANKSIALNAEFAADLPMWVLGDPQRLRQVLSNLIANALKFTEIGHVLLRVSRESDGFLLFEVRDSGIGIAPEAIGGLFSAFTQADASTTRRFGGSGLGLMITRQLVELMGGEVRVQSEPGVGSVFKVYLPLPSTEAGVAVSLRELRAHTQVPESGAKCVLVVEDNPVNLELALAMLEALGYDTKSCEHGRAALSSMLERDFDLILMDCQMPEMDGLEATQRWRDIERQQGRKRQVPIIALTADITEANRDRCRNVGMSDYLIKPYSLSQLEDALRRWLDASSGHAPVA